jgi:hypothetical protein
MVEIDDFRLCRSVKREDIFGFRLNPDSFDTVVDGDFNKSLEKFDLRKRVFRVYLLSLFDV